MGRAQLIRSPDRKIGLADVERPTGRIKPFTLREAIQYSYVRDTRFVLLVCALVGFFVWWKIAPSQLLLKPDTLSAADLGMLCRVAKDTFVNNICSSHQVPSPCECGEPLNQLTRGSVGWSSRTLLIHYKSIITKGAC